MEPAIRVENIGKLYRVAQNRDKVQYHTLRDTLVDYVKAPFRRLKQAGMSGNLQDFWALKDVSFEVQPGEVVGIIGRNGAGKSTLLKILSRITKPTTGRIEINGRVGSLLEVGTGFHPELTGRENIYLNGSILGMSRAEIKAKFEEIVAFAEVEQFLDTPVKRYSSGMYVRLAFAVAAHLQPEILIVDEVLAVGDAAFQKKCIGKMQDVAQQGRTVLLVSHQMSTIARLATRAGLLECGVMQYFGNTLEAIQTYRNERFAGACRWNCANDIDKPIAIVGWELSGDDMQQKTDFDVNEPVKVSIHFCLNQKISQVYNIALNVNAVDGDIHLLSTQNIDAVSSDDFPREPGCYCCTATIPAPMLNKGKYISRISCGIPGIQIFDRVENLSFSVSNRYVRENMLYRHGYIIPAVKWNLIDLGTPVHSVDMPCGSGRV